MKEKELICKIREFNQIRPSKEWVFLTKTQILGEEKEFGFLQFLFSRPVLSGGLIFLILLIGLFGFAQNSLPGDLFFPIKKIAEKSQAVFVSQEELPKVQLELANKRIEELNRITQNNQVKKLPPAIKEVQTSLTQVAKNLVESKNVDKETIDDFVNLKQKLKKVETTLSTKIASQENEEVIENLEKNTVEILIKDLENSTLTEKQEKLLAQMKELVKEENYFQALELYLRNQLK